MKAKARMMVVALAIVLMAIVSTSAFAGWKSEITKSNRQDAINILRVHMNEASMTDADKWQKSAKTLELAKMIYRNTATDTVDLKTAAEANFKLGIILANNGEILANTYFTRAIAKHPGKYNARIVDAQVKAANREFQKGKFDNAQNFAKEATKRGADIGAINNQFFATAKTWFRNGNIKTAEKATDIIIRNGFNKQTVFNSIIKIGHELNGEAMVDTYRYANKLCSVKCEGGRKAGLRVVTFARSIEDPKVYSNKIKHMIDFAINMTTDEDKVQPYVVVYKTGKYKFYDLPTGTITSHWIATPERPIHFYGIAIRKGKHQILYDDGSKVRLWTEDEYPVGIKCFKFQTLEAGGIRLKINTSSSVAAL